MTPQLKEIILKENVGIYNKMIGIYCLLIEEFIKEQFTKHKLEPLYKPGIFFNEKDWELIKKWPEEDYEILEVTKNGITTSYQYEEEDKVPGTKTIWNFLKRRLVNDDYNRDFCLYPFCETYNCECEILCEYMENHGNTPCGDTSPCGKLVSDTSYIECIIEDYNVKIFPNTKELIEIVKNVENICT